MADIDQIIALIDAGLVSNEHETEAPPTRRHAYNCTCFRCEDIHEPITIAPRHYGKH